MFPVWRSGRAEAGRSSSTAGPGVIDLTYTKQSRDPRADHGAAGQSPVLAAVSGSNAQPGKHLSQPGWRHAAAQRYDRPFDWCPSSNQIIVRVSSPAAGLPGCCDFPCGSPAGVTDVLQPVRDAKLTMDGRFVLAPVPIIRSFDQKGQPVAYNQFQILGPVRGANLPARVLTEADGVTGGPMYAAISPDGDSALIVNGLDLGGAGLLTGLASDDAARFNLKPLPFPFFGPPFPLGPNGPPVLAPHASAVFLADGKTALVENWVIPPFADSPLVPSISVLTGFDTGNIHSAAHLMDPILNTFDNNQQIAAVPSGLLDYVNLYLPAGAARDTLSSLVNQAWTAAGRGDPNGSIIEPVARFILTAADLRRQGVLNRAQVTTLITLAAAGVQMVTGPVTNLSSEGMIAGVIATDSMATLHGAALTGSQLQITIVDTAGTEHSAILFQTTSGRIDYLVPRGAQTGKAVAIVSRLGEAIAVVTMDIEPIADAVGPEVKRVGARKSRVIAEGHDVGAPGAASFLIFGAGTLWGMFVVATDSCDGRE